jgi:hypothetical protein
MFVNFPHRHVDALVHRIIQSTNCSSSYEHCGHIFLQFRTEFTDNAFN